VALHFENIDIEATSANFANYLQKSGHILPIEEIISINLLDITDEYFKTHKVSNESTLESARIAYILSSQRNIVKHNLDAAYTNLVSDKLKANEYSSAIKYALKSDNKELINTVGHNGALYYMKANKYKTALDFSKHSKDELKLNKLIYHNEAVNYYNSGNYKSATNAFERANDQDGVKSCYEALFREEQQKLGYVGTVEDIKNKSATIDKMNSYANKAGNQSMIKYVDKLKKYL
jgi:tetratricopeptide (TPR) repeat protein